MIPEQTLLGFPLFGDNATKVEPDNNKKSNGWQQGDVVPAEWMNWEWYHASKGVADLNKGVSSMEKEINNVLSSFGITPAEATNNQLLTAMRLNASFVSASSTTITGPLLVSGGTIRVMFTAAIAGSDTTTKLTLSYNTQNIDVKVYKDGSLEDFTAAKISWQDSSAAYRYLDAGTTLELLYNGSYFIIVNNPVVLKSIRHTIYADGTVAGGHVGLTAIAFTDTLDYGWLACEHQSLLRADYPRLFNYFQTHKIGSSTMLDIFGSADSTHFYLPDTREAALVGAGQNDSDSIATHDVYTVGQYKDDCDQRIIGSVDAANGITPISIFEKGQGAFYQENYINSTAYHTSGSASGYTLTFDSARSVRTGNVSRSKSKGVKYIIKVL
jgi:hypothetical protein